MPTTTIEQRILMLLDRVYANQETIIRIIGPSARRTIENSISKQLIVRDGTTLSITEAGIARLNELDETCSP